MASPAAIQAYSRRRSSMTSPLSASTPTTGLLDLDPRKTPAAAEPGGYNAQSAANAKAAYAAPPPAPASSVRGSPALPAPVPPPTQPPAPLGGYAQRAGGTWGPATPSLTMPPAAAAVALNQVPAAPAGNGAVSTKHTVEIDPGAKIFPGPNGTRLTRAEWEQYQKVLGSPTLTLPGGVTQAMQGTGSQAAASNLTPPQATEVQATAAKTPYDDPLIQSLLKEVQGRIAGNTTAAQERMNDRAQQQANASRQEVDRRLAGRNLGATNPLRDKMYNDIQANVNDQIALRDAQLQQQAQEQALSLFNAVQQAKNADAYRQQIASSEGAYNAALKAQEKQQGLNNIMSLVGMLPGAPAAITGFNALKNLFTGGGSSSPSPNLGSMELGFRNPYDASWVRR